MTEDDLLSSKFVERADRWRKKKQRGRGMMIVMLDQWMVIDTEKTESKEIEMGC